MLFLSITQKNKVCQVYLNLLAYGKFGTKLHATLLMYTLLLLKYTFYCKFCQVYLMEFIQNS